MFDKVSRKYVPLSDDELDKIDRTTQNSWEWLIDKDGNYIKVNTEDYIRKIDKDDIDSEDYDEDEDDIPPKPFYMKEEELKMS